MFELQDVSKRFGEEYALRELSMTIGGGMNFIIGSSGSGKTSLLKILSGMDQDFEGEVSYAGKSLSTLSPKEKSELWGSTFGFVWQDFNLLDDRTVLENVMLPQYLKQGAKQESVSAILRELNISQLANQKVGKLSGGQKQRVSIARELMKNPQVIFADEPTSALDPQSSKAIMDILRSLSKKRTVIIVTHDTSLIHSHDNIYELDKGDLVSTPVQENIRVKKSSFSAACGHLSFGSALSLGLTSIKRHSLRSATTALSLLLAATLLLVSVSGAITDSSKATFEELLATYGESLLDITVAQSFMSAGATDGQNQDKPNADVTQNVDGLFEKYKNDPRVSYVLFAQAFNDIKINVDGKEYRLENSNTMPVANGLLEGSMPMGETKEVAVPESFVKKLGLSNQEAIGKEIHFRGSIFEWENNQPFLSEVETKATIVGVIDTNMTTEYGGQMHHISIDDSFFFSPQTLQDMLKDTSLKGQPGNFYIRVNTPQDLIAIKDELNAKGIVPLGRFELVEDMVRLDQQSTQQSGTAVMVIAVLSVLIVLAVAFLNASLRRREYAIFKVSGYTNSHLIRTTMLESSLLSVATALSFLLLSPLLNLATSSFWNVNILNGKLLAIGVLLTLCMSVLSLLVSTGIAASTKTMDALRTGDR